MINISTIKELQQVTKNKKGFVITNKRLVKLLNPLIKLKIKNNKKCKSIDTNRFKGVSSLCFI
ncbi:MAG: hypothetical protein ACRC57_12765 [Sarcina sp.]